MFFLFLILIFKKFSATPQDAEYFFSALKVTYNEAIQDCIDRGMEILYIHDNEQLEEVKEVLERNPEAIGINIWISSFGIPKNNPLLSPWLCFIYNHYIDGNGEANGSFSIIYYRENVGILNGYVCYKRAPPETATIDVIIDVPITSTEIQSLSLTLPDFHSYSTLNYEFSQTETLESTLIEHFDPNGIYLTMTQTIMDPTVILVRT